MAFNLFRKREAPDPPKETTPIEETPSDLLLQALINGEKIFVKVKVLKKNI